MENGNPYQPPKAALLDETNTVAIELAGRGQRLAAAIIDTLIQLLFIVPVMYGAGYFELMQRGQEPSLFLAIGVTAVGFVLFAVVHGYLLKTNGQTIGKKLLGIRITDMNNTVPSLGRLLGLRYLPLTAISVIPVVGQFLPFIDALFIFKADRRCIHDHIAGTKVIRAK